jgi:Uma2 family endonuclease
VAHTVGVKLARQQAQPWHRTDQLADLQEKMQEYIDTVLVWGLIDRVEKRVHVYRPGQPVEVLDDPVSVSGDPILPGFVLNVRELW